METDTYTDRTLEPFTVKESSKGNVTTTDGWGWGCPVELVVGRTYEQETKGFNTVTGVRELDGTWLYRRSDQDLERQQQEYRDELARQQEERLEANKDAWRSREKALPDPLRQRLINFRNHGGRGFDLAGWGYELVVCELTVLYAASAGQDSAEVNVYAEREGTSGNQHGYAKALARLLAEDPDQVGQTVSALTPITGDPFYEEERHRDHT